MAEADATFAFAATIMAALSQPPHPLPTNTAAALTMINVRSHVLVILELNPPNYSIWKELFLILVGNFGATSDIDGTPALNNPDATWTATDFSVRSLIYAASSPEVMCMIMEPNASSYTIC